MPVKLYVLIKRNPAISPKDFRHLYETGHSRFGIRNFGHLWTDYRRTYFEWDHLTTGKAVMTGADVPIHDLAMPYDAMAEVVYPDMAAYAEASRMRRDPEMARMIPADERASGFAIESSSWLVSTDEVIEDLPTALRAVGNKHV